MDTKTKLYMVSLGPANWELVTIKALKALQTCGAICIPTKSKDHSFTRSITYKIIKDLMDEYGFSKPIIPVYAPMHFKKKDWQYQVDILEDGIKKYESVSFVTLGDAAVYSTVYYLLDMIKKQNKKLYKRSEVIAGITSFSYASSRVKKPLCLGDNRFEIIPLLGKEVPSTKVYMRPKVGLDTKHMQEDGTMYTFQNLNFVGEHIQKGKIQKVEKYMTLFIDFLKTKKGKK
ncbi:Uroporphyrin-III C/tetrapyrrole (Corrin/Porphyrin) methyltransferase [Arcobacter nitrofigilis DSM 7299]|uniref:Uroporphyrin-III C/tetrapyrrole (Corrin/Porphyrin) methyltransferase n=1 Tax=Arcobacter nitrofigilis (strain ATCC 33309 / DSM 7299 / CCUG 15893 / LMG 7604 / NCTC 12251 / CI) TaxID=572480 RepID=D5V0N5_ARCNC|nr:SAM-dependent methyltransferase [Arcobacter nitrofigilis]ADG93847.1 Uroporphyrin-III C/tetrapyrrole (Corrin/Porphyrin) methyltransferase [Arcobacter nitrofigilis DSM 7299]